MKILPNNSSLIYSGRIDLSDPFAIVWTYPGTFVRMKFKGTQLFIHVRNKHNYWNNYLGVAEGDAQTKLLLPEEGEATIEIPLQTTQDNIHEVTIFKRQDACHELTILGFEINCNTDDECELLEASPLPPRRIEVYGDSVSAGEVSEAIDYVAKADPEHNGEYSNSWYSYAWIAARKLDAQLHDIASHPDDYMKTDYEGEKAKNWRIHYRQFLAKLRETYPDAWIICCTTLLQHDIGWDMSISQAVLDIADKKISHCVFQRNGKATPGHLRIPEAEEMAEELCHYIHSLNIEGY